MAIARLYDKFKATGSVLDNLEMMKTKGKTKQSFKYCKGDRTMRTPSALVK